VLDIQGDAPMDDPLPETEHLSRIVARHGH
jgi:hypothetical protein